MRTDESMALRGGYEIEAFDAQTGDFLWSRSFDNLLTAVNQTARAQMLAGGYVGDGSEFEIKYFAFGTGVTPPTAADETLEAEVYRKQITQQVIDGGTVTSVVSLGALEANYVIREVGVFCGPAATADADSGLMISRVGTFIDKNTNLVLNVIRKDICTI